MGECLTDREFDDMMKLAHVDDDGKVDYEGNVIVSLYVPINVHVFY
jgi:Ca2+-binding EF-hand superfamily protein